jgi:hypothetical protein
MLVPDLRLAAFHLLIPLGHHIQGGLGSSSDFGQSSEEPGAIR